MTDLLCCEGVDRKGEYQPCDKPAVAMRLERHDSPPTPYPVCVAHCRVGEMVILQRQELCPHGRIQCACLPNYGKKSA